jgi:hypothetical protein
MQVSSNGSGVNPPHDRRAALVKEFAETNEQLRLLKVKASKLHAKLIALKGVNKVVPSNTNSGVDSKFNDAQQRLEKLRQRNRNLSES